MKQQTDELGELIVAKGFAPNLFVLDNNHLLTVPQEFALPAPWNLPSRMFRFPIEVCEPDEDGSRKIGLMHPLLADHPFVKHVEATLGLEIDRDGAPNAYGFSKAPTARWWHAVDLVIARHWRDLLDTQAFTEPRYIMQAVAFGCSYSHHEDRNATGYITTAEAREIMREIGATEPSDRSAIIRSFSAPSPCRQDSGKEHWPINYGPMDAENVAWGMIHGIEDGWFRHDRAGFLQWSETGRDRYAAGDSTIYTEATGQTALAF